MQNWVNDLQFLTRILTFQKDFIDQKRDEKDVQIIWSDISVYYTINGADKRRSCRWTTSRLICPVDGAVHRNIGSDYLYIFFVSLTVWCREECSEKPPGLLARTNGRFANAIFRASICNRFHLGWDFLALLTLKASYIHLRITGDPPFECMQKNISTKIWCLPPKIRCFHVYWGRDGAEKEGSWHLKKKKVCRRRRASTPFL